MAAILESALPLFALILLGYGAARFRVLGDGAITGLNAFVFWFALPTMLFFTMARAPVRELFDWRLAAAMCGTSSVVFAITLALGLLVFPRRTIAERAVVAGTACFGNLGYLGLPLVIGTLGPQAGPPAGFILMADNLFTIALIMTFLEIGAAGRTSAVRVVRRVLTGFFRNPFMIGMILGFGVGWFEAPIPAAVDRFGTILGGAAGPCALFALGGTLYGKPIADGRAEVGLAVLLKLVLMPTVGLVIAAWGLGLPQFEVLVFVVLAGLPTGAGVFVLATQYGVAVARASTAVLVTTALSVLTVPALLIWLGG